MHSKETSIQGVTVLMNVLFTYEYKTLTQHRSWASGAWALPSLAFNSHFSNLNVQRPCQNADCGSVGWGGTWAPDHTLLEGKEVEEKLKRHTKKRKATFPEHLVSDKQRGRDFDPQITTQSLLTNITLKCSSLCNSKDRIQGGRQPFTKCLKLRGRTLKGR